VTELLETKLQPPPLRPSAVERVRLLDRLGREGVPKLVLVSAPPGFGKSTLVTQWIASLRVQASLAWVSLGPEDADPVRFWRYVATAVERAAPGTGKAALGHLAGDEARIDLATIALVNDLAAIDRELLLVLDDLHVVEDREVAAGLTFLLDHLPPRAHLVILTRADPPLPIARLRALGELAEVRAADLRFTVDEASAYLNGPMGLGLGDLEVTTLEARTEGWIAALQLAALSMRGRDDPASFVAAFAGDDRFVVDYLTDEVLERQTDVVRTFLLSTSILERLTGSLCDALTNGTGGAATLETLERANLFLIPLDDRRRWYRYHHLFADLLRARLVEQRPDEIATLHARASAWWEAHDEPHEAITHALAGGDVDRAADLIEVAAHELRRTRQEATLRRWLDALPGAAFAFRPVLAIAHAGVLLATGETRGVEARLAAAERWITAS
jgi:LuxR family transcriptional regulator, maltose regulon positive regulatory protein